MRIPPSLAIPILVVALLLPAIPLAPDAAALTDYSENFDNDTAGGLPSESWYTFAPTGNVFVSSASPIIGTRSLLVGDGAVAEFDSPSSLWDACGGGLAVAFRFNEVPNVVGFTEVIQVRDGAAGTAWSLLVSDAGVFQGRIGATTVNFAGVSFVFDEWYNATMYFTSCNDNKMTIFLAGNSQEGAITIDAASGTAGLDRFKFLLDGASWASTASAKWDLVVLGGVNDPPPTAVSSSATAIVTDLQGSSVDSSGSNWIVRTDNGATVRTFATSSDDGTLDEIANDPNTDCVADRFDGVVATGFGNPDTVVGYLTCDVTANDPNYFRIRAQNLQVPDINCSAECDFDIVLDTNDPASDTGICTFEQFDDRTDLLNIKQIFEVPMDYTYVVQDPLGEDPHLAVAWAYTTEAGRIGVAEYTTQDGCNGYNTQRTSYSSTAPEDFCSWRYNGKNYLAAVDQASPTKLWTYTTGTSESGAALRGSISVPVSFPSLNGGVGISCAADKMLVQQATRISLVDIDDGSIVWSKDVANAPIRGVELDPSGDWAFWIDDPTPGSPYPVYIGYAGNGTSFATVTSPTSFWYSMHADANAQNLWIATEGLLAWYELARNLDEIPETCAGVSCEVPEDEAPGQGAGVFLFGDIALPGTETVGGRIAWGLAILILLAMLGFALMGGVKRAQNKEPIGQGPTWGAGLLGFAAFPINVGVGLWHPVFLLGAFLAVVGLILLNRRG